MGKRIVCLAGVVSLAVGVAAAQPSTELIDVYTVRVKQDKRQEFENAIKRMAEVNRRHGGDRWIAFSNVYGGDHGTIHFASARQNIGEVEVAMQSFEKAVAKGIGASNLPKFFSDYSATVLSERGEIRVRRPDLSLNFPDSPEGRNGIVGQSRYLRMTIVRAKPGMTPGLIDAWTKIRSSMESAGVKHPIGVSMATTGPSGVFYFTSFAKSFEDLGAQAFDLPKALGEEAYRSLQKDISEVVAEHRVEIYKFSPELSNPPDELTSAAPDFWRPKPAVAATKAKTAGSASAQ